MRAICHRRHIHREAGTAGRDAGLYAQAGAALIGHVRHNVLKGVHIDGHEVVIHIEGDGAAAPVLDLHELIDIGARFSRDLSGASHKAAGVQCAINVHRTLDLHLAVVTNDAAHAGCAVFRTLHRIDHQLRGRGHRQAYLLRHRQRAERLAGSRLRVQVLYRIVGSTLRVIRHHQGHAVREPVGGNAVHQRHIGAGMTGYVCRQHIIRLQ